MAYPRLLLAFVVDKNEVRGRQVESPHGGLASADTILQLHIFNLPRHEAQRTVKLLHNKHLVTTGPTFIY